MTKTKTYVQENTCLIDIKMWNYFHGLFSIQMAVFDRCMEKHFAGIFKSHRNVH